MQTVFNFCRNKREESNLNLYYAERNIIRKVLDKMVVMYSERKKGIDE